MSEGLLELRSVDKFYNPGGANEVHAVRAFDMACTAPPAAARPRRSG